MSFPFASSHAFSSALRPLQLTSVTLKAFLTAHCSSYWSICNYILPYPARGMLVSYNFHITPFSLFKQSEILRTVWLGWNWNYSRFGILWKSRLFPSLHRTKKLLLKERFNQLGKHTGHTFKIVTVKTSHGAILRFISIFMTELEFDLREMALMINDFIDSVLIFAMRTKKGTLE